MPLTGHTVLIVEDEPLIALDIAESFRDANAEVLEASNLLEDLHLGEGGVGVSQDNSDRMRAPLRSLAASHLSVHATAKEAWQRWTARRVDVPWTIVLARLRSG